MKPLVFACTALVATFAAAAVLADEAPQAQAAAAAPALEVSAAEAEEEAQQQLRRTLRQMRTLFEQEDAQAQAIAHANTQSLQLASMDMPSIGAMREQLTRQFERLEDRCFGMDAKVNGGNLIVICGDNAGSAENANIGSGNSSTTIVVPPPPAAPEAKSQPAEESAP
jgi:hypothetical protein